MKITAFRIARSKYAGSLRASGVANRWNLEDEWVLYVGSLRSLSTLELLVHRAAIQPWGGYKVMIIEIDMHKESDTAIVPISALPRDWRAMQSYQNLQQIGSQWYKSRNSFMLEVPSVVIPQESNYVLHTRHPRFQSAVRLIGTEDYFWDSRLLIPRK